MTKLATGTPVTVHGSPHAWTVATDDGGPKVTVQRVVLDDAARSNPGAVGKIARRTVFRTRLRKPQ